MELDSAHSLISAAKERGRIAHGYLIVGGVRGSAMQLALAVLKDFFPDRTEENLLRHPDIHWVRPEMKSRVISVDSMHTKLIDPLSKTSYSGGWKVGVIVAADRMNETSANSFLKILEEPTDKTLFLLLTEAPEQLLPTIVSRCQRIDLPDANERRLGEPWRTNVLGALSDPSLADATARGLLMKSACAEKLAAILEGLEKLAEREISEELKASGQEGEDLSESEVAAIVSSRYREYRHEFLATVMEFFAARMRAAPCASAYRNVEAVEDMAKSFERNMNELMVLSFFMDRVRFA